MHEDFRNCCEHKDHGPLGGLFGGDNMILIIIVFLLFCTNGFGGRG